MNKSEIPIPDFLLKNSAQTLTEFPITKEEVMSGILWNKGQLMTYIFDQAKEIQELRALLVESLCVICDLRGMHMRMNNGKPYNGPIGDHFEIVKNFLSRLDVKAILEKEG